MSNAFYPKMALSNIRKNKKTYVPYILACTFTIMMFYMMSSIINNENINSMQHAENVVMLLGVGLWVCRIFAFIFLFYTNSFLIKRRQKEIGLYNILGMEKRHIGKMMLFETGFIALVTLLGGILLGIVFGKLFFLLLIKLIQANSLPAFEVPVKAVAATIVYFCAIYAATYFYNLIKIRFTKPIELLHGSEVGEKEPKTKIIMTIIGIVCIGIGYGFALTVESPLKAMMYFMAAVVLVVIGTYALFTAGSIAFIKILKRNKGFYYQTKHFTSVSGMLYRMKQNAVGLANICILSTMVLISISTTVSLYAGMEDTVKSAYPGEINVTVYGADNEDDTKNIDDTIAKLNSESGATIKNYYSEHAMTVYLKNSGNYQFEDTGSDSMDAYMDSSTAACLFMSADEFNKMNGSNYKLTDNEVLLYTKEKADTDTLSFVQNGNTKDYKIKEKLGKVNDVLGLDMGASIIKTYLVVVNNFDQVNNLVNTNGDASLDGSGNITYYIQYDTNLSKEDSIKLTKNINSLESKELAINANNQYSMRDELHQMYGSFLFLGMFVGILFLMAAVLIIYYKQITEGYEDCKRFEIMQKVGMSHAEVRKTIRSQILTVFFFPLIVAAIHVAVAFRIVKKLLSILLLGNTSLFIICTLVTLLVFCIIYGIVFMLTAKAYYKIVSTAE